MNGAQLHVAFLERALKKSGGEPEMLEAVNVVGDEIKRLADLVTEFLDFARPRPPQRKPTPVFARSASGSLRLCVTPQAERRPTSTLALDLPTRDVELLNVDPAKIEQVLPEPARATPSRRSNSRRGGGRVTLRVRRQPRQVHLEVGGQTGLGLLPSPDMPIFDPFFSTKSPSTARVLGLAITHRIVTDHHGGDLHVREPSRAGHLFFASTLPIDSK